jgi:NADH dehydrogenase [ubiquinone] 1 alpha subcomplex assembly factor 1
MKLVLILLLNGCIAQGGNGDIIFDSSKSSSLKDWKVVNDGVMGGISNSTIILNKEGNVEFKGIVSTANNGGFASIRYRFEKKFIKGRTTIKIRLKGDSKPYQFRVKSKSNDYYSYITTFSTSNKWETIEIALSDLFPSFRGYKLDQPNFESSSIEEISFLISNKKNEAFKLEIDKIEIK